MLCVVWRGVSGCVCFRELSGPVEVPCAGSQSQGGLLKRLFGADGQQDGPDGQTTAKSASQAGIQPETQTTSLPSNIRTVR